MQQFGISSFAPPTSTQWDAINTANGGRLNRTGDAVLTFTGRAERVTLMGSVTIASLQADLAAGNFVTAASHVPALMSAGSPVVASHIYAVLQVYLDPKDGVWKVETYNPHGRRETITWAQFRAGFRDVCTAAEFGGCLEDYRTERRILARSASEGDPNCFPRLRFGLVPGSGPGGVVRRS